MKTNALLLAVLMGAAACTRAADTATTSTAPPTNTSTTVAEASTTTAQAPGIEELSPELQAELSELIATTEELRGLDFVDPPQINVVTPDELEALVREGIEEDTEFVDVDQALFRTLGLLDDETDLMSLYTDVLGEQVAGFYDTDTLEMVVPMRSEGFSALERSTIVHELTHALADQHFGIGDIYDELIDGERYDEASAFQAVVEGDAVQTELSYLRGLSIDEQREVIEESLAVDSSALDSAPRFLQESLLFPYVSGQVFVERLQNLGGREAVDAAYSDRPVSTEQILTPEDYGRDQPVVISLLDVALDGYQRSYGSVWGELSFELMFNQILGGRPEAAEGWGGDRYDLFFDGTDVALVLVYQGDSEQDTTELEQALIEYHEAVLGAAPDAGGVFTADDYAFVSREGAELRWVVASDPSAGATLTAALSQ
ncbi:MAG: hypothetical protein OEX04_02445 [Acidimicrobiia bacterium]|nr:hypothetical protein [Acidimicrobiia bacterium]MDH4306314.1 hypothetical protein [Acidimicrobiia bacterium]